MGKLWIYFTWLIWGWGVEEGDGVALIVVSERWDCDLYPELDGLSLEDMLLPESTIKFVL